MLSYSKFESDMVRNKLRQAMRDQLTGILWSNFAGALIYQLRKDLVRQLRGSTYLAASQKGLSRRLRR